MKKPKYIFYIGKFKTDFATKLGYYSGATFVEDSSYRASLITPIPESRKVFFLNSSQNSTNTRRIQYFNASEGSAGSKDITRGIITMPNTASYAIYYLYNDVAFKDDYFMAELEKVNPHYTVLSKKYAKESGQEFFRTSLDGKMTLFGDDYELINSASVEDKFVFCIEKISDDSTTKEYYSAIFSKVDCKFDHLKKSCELSNLVTADQYINILDKYDNTYDLIKLAPELTSVQLCKRCAIQIYIKGGNTISTFFNGTYMEEDVNTVIDNDSALVNTYHFALISIYNEIQSGNVPGYSNAGGEYISSDGGWQNNYGYSLKLEKVASAGDSFTGTYAVNTIYNINTGAGVNNVQTAGSGETSYTIFRNDTYALRLKSQSGAITIAESTIYFYRPDSSKIYFSGFDTITMKMSSSDQTYTLTNILPYSVYQRLLCDVDSVLSTPTYNIPYDDIVSSNSNYDKVIGLGNNLLGTIYSTVVTTSTPTKYGKNELGFYYTDQFLPSIIGVSKLYPICRSSWGNTSLWFAYNDTMFNLVEASSRKYYTIKDCFQVGHVIQTLLKQIDPTIKHELTAEYSSFLYGSNIINNVSFRVFITPKSNILKGEYDEPAQKAEITLEDVMDMLAKCFQCYWFIDEQNRFIIENIYYFNNNKSYTPNSNYQIDLTKIKDAFNGKSPAVFQKAIEYNKDNVAKRYEFGLMDDCTEAFDSVTMDINSNYVQQDKTEDVTVNQFTTDVDFMLYKPDNFSEDGFALLCPRRVGSAYQVPIVKASIIGDDGLPYETALQNWYASWSYLVSMIYRYNLPAQNATINTTGAVTAADIMKIMSQEIEFFSTEDPDALQLIRTSFGNGKIDEMSVKLDTRLVTTTLVYKPS